MLYLDYFKHMERVINQFVGVTRFASIPILCIDLLELLHFFGQVLLFCWYVGLQINILLPYCWLLGNIWVLNLIIFSSFSFFFGISSIWYENFYIKLFFIIWFIIIFLMVVLVVSNPISDKLKGHPSGWFYPEYVEAIKS